MALDSACFAMRSAARVGMWGSTMTYEVDNEYPFSVDEQGVPYLPDSLVKDGNLYVLPNGKYLPRGVYRTEDGGHLIYEPSALSPYADRLECST